MRKRQAKRIVRRWLHEKANVHKLPTVVRAYRMAARRGHCEWMCERPVWDVWQCLVKELHAVRVAYESVFRSEQ